MRRTMLALGAGILLMAAGAAQGQAPAGGTPPASSTPTSRPEAGAPAQGTTQGKTATKPEQRFLIEAIQGDLAEVEMGKLAQEKGGTEAVKAFGETLVKDHSEHAEKVKQVGESLGVTLPTQSTATQTTELANMRRLSGQRFDREFVLRMINDHRRDITRYQVEAKRSGPIADMAKETLPVLQKHLQMAQDLNSQKGSQR